MRRAGRDLPANGDPRGSAQSGVIFLPPGLFYNNKKKYQDNSIFLQCMLVLDSMFRERLCGKNVN